jgi:hypothetical protein
MAKSFSPRREKFREISLFYNSLTSSSSDLYYKEDPHYFQLYKPVMLSDPIFDRDFPIYER